MKILTIILIFSFTVGFSQTAEYGKLTRKAKYQTYLTKTGDVLNIGDTLIIGIPTSDLGYTYIMQGNERLSSTLADKKVIIDKLKTYGTKKSGYKMYAHFRGYGLIPALIDYDTALELGEIKNPNAKLTRAQAIKKLKESKDLLDLGLITLSDYDQLKAELTPLIMD